MPVSLDEVRSRLKEERRRLLAELDELEKSASTAEEKRESTPFGKRDEGATETQALEKRLALEKRVRGQLDDVERALQKIEEGSYGLCDGCRRPINPERLEALPQANLCMMCKTKLRPR